ncbi:MAG: AI-2E family transporter [Acidobacteria bacterium]|nr:AI-2E family transporter [Acidobacteriota bacterium]
MAFSPKLSRLFLVTCLVVVLALFVVILSPFLTPVLLAAVVATLFYPCYKFVSKKLGNRPNLSAFLMCMLVTFLIILPTFLVAVTLASEIQRAFVEYDRGVKEGSFPIAGSQRLLVLWDRATKALGLPGADLGASAQAAIREAGLFLVRNSSAIVAGFATLVADFFIMLFTLFFLFRDGKSFLHEVMEFVPLSPGHQRRMVDRFKETIYATFFGSFVTATAQGVATWLILWILKFQNAGLLGTLAAFTSLVPMVGAGLVWVPASIYLLLLGNWPSALILAAYGVFVISLLDNILRPLMIRTTSRDMHTLLIFFGILGGISIFGFSGLVVGPMIVAFMVTVLDMVKLEFNGSAD